MPEQDGVLDWYARTIPAWRRESHFGDRVVACFADRPRSIWQMFDKALARRPGHEALVCGDTRWSYAQADSRIRAIAAGLRAQHIGAGERIAMLLSNRAEFFFVYLAIQRVGAIAVPISVREQGPGVAFVLAQCGARAIFHDAELGALVPKIPALLAVSMAPLAAGDPAPEPGAGKGLTLSAFERAPELAGEPCVVDEEAIATLLYTSGTTGRPKGAMLTHLGIIHSALHFRHCAGLGAKTRSLLAVPASHVTGLVAIMLSALACAGTTVVLPSFSPAGFLALAARERITFTVLVPAMYALCLLREDLERYDLSAWVGGGFGGAPMPVATIDALAARLPALELINAYGATETTSPATMMPPGYARSHADSVGAVLPLTRVCVMDENGRELAPGQTGELWISGPMVVRGYWDNPSADASEFTGGWWHSGDLGTVDPDGFVRVFDRKKDMINRGGFKIYSVEVENHLLGFDGVHEAAVVGVPCPVLGERVHAFVFCDDRAELNEAALRAWCASALADYKVPESIRFELAALPRNANGKLLKRVLRERLATR